jgi:hypothetical protein
MIANYPIYRLTAEMKAMSDLSVEREGMLEKAWFVHPELGDCLFKKSAPSGREIVGCQTDWSEKIAFELAQLLDIPAARYELAEAKLSESDPDLIRGSISCSYISAGGEAISGEAFLSEIYPTYQRDYPELYSVGRVLAALQNRQVQLPSGYTPPPGITTGAELFVGYLLIDAWVGNDDRHDCNFEIKLVEDRVELAPTFDHGKAMGATMSEVTRDRMSVESYNRFLESGFWQNDRKISTFTAFEVAADLYPVAAKIWLERLVQLDDNRIAAIFDRVPDERITATAAKFAQDLLEANRDLILSNFVARETSEFSLLLDIPATITKLTDDRKDADDLSLGG